VVVKEEVKDTCDRCADFLETELDPTIATGTGGAWPPTATRPAFADVKRREDSCLKNELRRIMQETRGVTRDGTPIRRFAAMRVGLIAFDATGGVRCAFNNDGQASIGSMGKLAIVYAAFQLRGDVRRVARAENIRNIAALAARVRRLAGLTDTRPDETQKDEEGRDDTRSWLEWIFGKPDLGRKLADGDFDRIDFDGNGTGGVDRCGLTSLAPEDIPAGTRSTMDVLQPLADNDVGSRSTEDSLSNWEQIAKKPFAKRLWMTTAWSNNRAANTCAHDVGMKYIGALMKKSGLATSRNLGLWLTVPYASPPTGHSTRFRDPGGPGTPPTSTAYKATAGPVALAALMIAIQRGARTPAGPTWRGLISPEASRDMEQFLRPLPFGGAGWHILSRSFSTPLADAFMKGGLTPPGKPNVSLSDWAYFEAAGRRVGIIILDSHRQRGVEDENTRLEDFTDRAWNALTNCVTP
jgi:hypothetical protein